LKAQSYPASLTTVFLVHNGSAAAQRQQAAQLAPEARHLTLARNRGWTGGNNAAIRVALSEAFAYVVMLNVDTVVDRGWLSGLVQAADEHPTIHIWQSRILLHGTTKINSLGNRIHYLGFGYCHGYGQPQTTSSSAAMVDYASGAAMLVKREVFETIGLFREDYMSYYDDMEFCWRARLVGYNVGVADASLCYHKYTFRKSPTRLYYLQRNRLMTLFSLERWGTLLMTLPCLLVAEGVLTGTVGRLFALAENYPDLKANQNMMQLSEELRSTENKVAFARQAFNDGVTLRKKGSMPLPPGSRQTMR